MTTARWLFVALAAVWPCCAQSYVTLVNSGSPANRVDIVVFGDGYTAQERTKFDTDVSAFIATYLAQSPYSAYRNYFNAHAVFVPSAESGADHPESSPAVLKNTAFDAAYNCAGIQRLICVNTAKVLAAGANAGLAPNQRDVMVVVVNDSVYGGSGGTVAVTSTHRDGPEIVLHEIGHSFGLLADEYTSNPPPCDMTAEPTAANSTLQTQRGNIKWGPWITSATAVPTVSTQLSVPGLYLGSDYCATGKYRPTYDSKMRSLGRSYDQINSEQLVKRIYNLVSPIESLSPAPGSLTGPAPTFSVATTNPASPLTVLWTVDGRVAAQSTSFSFDPGANTCPQSINLTVADPTSLVRLDPTGLLTESSAWTYSPAALTGTQGFLRSIANAANNLPSRPLAADSWVTVYGDALAAALTIPSDGLLRDSIDGVVAKVTDSQGVVRLARLQFVSPGQINFIVPPQTATGAATLQVCRPGSASQKVTISIEKASPGLFSANSSGSGLAAAFVLLVHANGAQENILVGSGAVATQSTDQVYLTLYGTGIKNPADRTKTRATVAGVDVPVLYAGAQQQYDALDQVNIGPLPASVKTAGVKDIVVEVDGVKSNTVQVQFR